MNTHNNFNTLTVAFSTTAGKIFALHSPTNQRTVFTQKKINGANIGFAIIYRLYNIAPLALILFYGLLKIILKYAGSRFGTHDCPNSENRAKCLANKLFEETPECGGVKIEGDLIYFENAFGREGDCAPIIADDFRLRV